MMNQPTDSFSHKLKRCVACRVLNRADAELCQACHGQTFEEIQPAMEFTPPAAAPASADIQATDGPNPGAISPSHPAENASKARQAQQPGDASTMTWLIIILFTLGSIAILAQPNIFMAQAENRIFIYALLVVAASLLTCKGRLLTFFSNMLAVVGTVVITSVTVSVAIFLAVTIRCANQ